MYISFTGIQIGFDPASYNVAEGSSTELVVQLTGDIEIPVQVFLSTSGLSATGIE